MRVSARADGADGGAFGLAGISRYGWRMDRVHRAGGGGAVRLTAGSRSGRGEDAMIDAGNSAAEDRGERPVARIAGRSGCAGWSSAALLFHMAAVLAGAPGRAAVVGAGAAARGRVHAVLRRDRPGLCVPLLRPRAAADAGGHGDASVRRRPARRDGPPARATRVLAAARLRHSGSWPWPTTCSPTSRRPKPAGDGEPEPLGAVVRPAPLPGPPRLHRASRCTSQLHLIPDPERVREALATPGATAGSTSYAEEFYTTPERIGDFPCDGF